mmetsp:Transcript_30891/g.88576  ORF Transcript_30891/g.88576 Transcript_30891/m.88576 type:complete len:220 (-) Transcript_30891:625-1284(-)
MPLGYTQPSHASRSWKVSRHLLVRRALRGLQRGEEPGVAELLAHPQCPLEDGLALLGGVCQQPDGHLRLLHRLFALAQRGQRVRQHPAALPRLLELQGPPGRGLCKVRLALTPEVLCSNVEQQLVAVRDVDKALPETSVCSIPVLEAEVHQRELRPDVCPLVVQQVGLADGLVAGLELVRPVLGVRHAAPGLCSGAELDRAQEHARRLLPPLLGQEHGA